MASVESLITEAVEKAVSTALANMDLNKEAPPSVILDGEVEVYNTEDVARLLKTSVATAREIMYRADFPLIKVGKNLKVTKQGFLKWSLERRV